jgi:5-methyltetrahydrofolate--homocysteine methyltransferase
MLIVGELINTSRKVIMESVEKRNAEYIRDIAKRQVEVGADYLDVNCSDMLANEPETMRWLIENIEAAVDAPLCIDTTNPVAMEAGLSMTSNGQPLANSITGEEERYKTVLPLIVKHRAKVVALCIDDQGMPDSAEDRLRVACELVKKLTEAGVTIDDIYLDPVLTPLSVGDRAGLEVLDAIRLIRQECPGVHLICGLSNVSFGLPNRKILNRVFLTQTMAAGMDAYILDMLDKTLMGYLYASQALLAQDPFCRNYLGAHRKGLYQY